MPTSAGSTKSRAVMANPVTNTSNPDGTNRTAMKLGVALSRSCSKLVGSSSVKHAQPTNVPMVIACGCHLRVGGRLVQARVVGRCARISVES